MNDEIKEFRDGIFALRTRRFGTVAELMIEALYSFTNRIISSTTDMTRLATKELKSSFLLS